MDDEAELSEAEVQELRRTLKALEGELQAALEASAQGAEVVSLEQPIGRVSRIDAIQQQKMAEASREQQRLRLGQVRVALDAIRTGSYGECKSCEEPIARRRLFARPETPFCLRCQGGRERG